MPYPIDQRVYIFGVNASYLCPTAPSRIGWWRPGKKAESYITSKTYLDAMLDDFSGYIAVDELYDGSFCYLSLVDQHNQRRLQFEVLEHNPTKEDMKAFLLRFRNTLESRGLVLSGVTTDDSPLYPEALAEIFPGVTHQICRFHILKEILLTGIRMVAKSRQKLRNRIPKRLRGRPSSKNYEQNKQIDELENLHSELFEHRYLFVRRELTELERLILTRISNLIPELQLLREIIGSVYALFDRSSNMSTALTKLQLLRERVHNDPQLSKALKKLDSLGLEKALNYLDDKCLPSTSNAVERGNRRLRKMQKYVYLIRSHSIFVRRIAMDMLRDCSNIRSYDSLLMLHKARSG